MIRVRPEQNQAFADDLARRFPQRVADFLREWFPDAEAMPQAALAREVEALLARARSWGLVTEEQLVVFVVTAWSTSKTFDVDSKEANFYLSAPQLGPDDKARWLRGYAERNAAESGAVR